jgi:predicted DNA-binding transcriptional regulator YafY
VTDQYRTDDQAGDTLVIEPSRAADGSVASVEVIEDGIQGVVDLSAGQAFEAAIVLLRLSGQGIEARTPTTIHGKAGDDDARLAWNTDAIAVAIAHERPVRFSYQKVTGPGGVIETRRLVPESIYQTRAGNSVVAGDDVDREDYRVFRLDRVVGHVEVLP